MLTADLARSRTTDETVTALFIDPDEEPDDAPHNKRDGDDEKGWVVDEEIRTDGGTMLGFLDTSHPQPWDNSQRLYTWMIRTLLDRWFV